jgi:hypothetical protein
LSAPLFSFELPNHQRIRGSGFTVIPRKGELIHFLTGEAPQSIYRVQDVEYFLLEDKVETVVVLSGS